MLSLLFCWERGSSISLPAENAVSSTVSFQLFYCILALILFCLVGGVRLV